MVIGGNKNLFIKNDKNFDLGATKAKKFKLNQEQNDTLLKRYKDIIHTHIPTIEKYGGGSARCMLTELF